jgi:hypothetical protein
MADAFTCSRCQKQYPADPSNMSTTGYGLDKSERKICFACCGELDAQTMRDTGKIALYLSAAPGSIAAWRITNWPGTLEFKVERARKGKHNIARTRTDAWFRDADGNAWHGVQYGENTQIVHCKRIGAEG